MRPTSLRHASRSFSGMPLSLMTLRQYWRPSFTFFTRYTLPKLPFPTFLITL